MASLRKGKVLKLKIIAFIITLTLIIFYDYFPKRSIDLHPKLTKHITISVDSTIGGNSELKWLDKDTLHWVCELKAGAPYPYCGMSISWSNAPFQQLDLSNFDSLEVDLTYNGQARYVRVFLRNYFPSPNMQDVIGKAKFNSISVPAKNFKQVVSISLNELRVADWWIDENLISPEEIKPDVSKVIAIGLDIPYPNVLGQHELKLNSLRVVGEVLAKESLYLAIIVFWAILLLVDMLFSQAKLRLQLQSDERKLEKLKVKSAMYQEKAEHDKLTSVLNREGLNRTVDDLYATQLLQQFIVLVIDLDHFKQINDKHGHAVGDNVLRETTTVLKNCTRSYDIVSRWGGEEFVILFHCMDTTSILPFAEKIRKSIESSIFADGKVDTVTASIGATKFNKSESFEHAFIRADKALYQAKESGRNKTVIIL